MKISNAHKTYTQWIWRIILRLDEKPVPPKYLMQDGGEGGGGVDDCVTEMGGGGESDDCDWNAVWLSVFRASGYFFFFIFSPPADRHNFNIVCCLKNKAIN